MANLTKGQLAAENEALRNELNTVREILRVANIDLHRAECEITDLVHEIEHLNSRPAPAAKAPRAAYEVPAWQVERKEKMERAREAAMQLRTMIKV